MVAAGTSRQANPRNTQISDEAKAVMPKKDNAFVEFKNHSNQIKAPFCIHADFECILKPIEQCVNECLSESSTQKYQSHEPCGFTVYFGS